MNLIPLNLCLIILAVLKTNFVTADDGSGQIHFHDDEEILPSDVSIDSHDVPLVQNSAQSGRRILRQSYAPVYNRNSGDNMGSQYALELLPASLVGQPLSAEASSASKQVVYATDFTRPSEETYRRLTRNPDAIDDIVGQFQELGSGMTKNLLQQLSQSAPDMSRSFGEALNEALSQSNILAQVAPANLDLSQLTQPFSQSNRSGSIDFGQLGEKLSQNFFVGATKNLLGARSGQNPTPRASSAASADTYSVGAAAPAARQQQEAGTDGDSQNPKNPFEQLVGHPLLPGLPGLHVLHPLSPRHPLIKFNPFGLLGQMASLMPMGSEISEVRVLPQQNSPFKVSPKQVELQTIAEMKLRAVLKDALNKKTIPILWFHLANKTNEHKTNEELEMETKLENFEKQVIVELKQLQELSKVANEVKQAQLQSGFQPTTSLNSKLNLFEIPIYDITLADIETTLKDDQVMALMQTLVQKKKDFQWHQQATTKYITDLTGTPIKRHTTPTEETLRNMEKDDMLKMMTYAYRMAALNGHEMPWVKTKMSSLDEKDINSSQVNSQQRQFMDQNNQMSGERQWLEEKMQRMRMEANPMMMMTTHMQQPQSFQRDMMTVQNPLSDMNMPILQQQQHENNQRQMMSMQNQMPDMNMPMQKQQQQHENNQRQMMPLQNQMPERENNQIQMMPTQNQMSDPNFPMQQQYQQQENNEIQMPPIQTQVGTMMQQQKENNQRQMMPTQNQMSERVNNQRQMMPMLNQLPMQQQHQQQQNIQRQMMATQNQMSDMNMPMQQHQQQQQNIQRQMMPTQNQMSGMNMPMQQQQEIHQRQMMPTQNPMSERENIQRQMMPQTMMNNFDMPQHTMPMQRQQQLNLMMQNKWMQRNFQQNHRNILDTSTPVEKRPEQSSETKTDVESEKMSKPEPSMFNPPPENETVQSTGKNMATVNESQPPKMTENDNKARFKGVDSLFGDFLSLGKGKQHAQQPKAVMNYYYNGGGSGYPPYYGHHSGYTGGHYHHSTPATHYHYGSAYRTAVGDEEIAEMLHQQQLLPKPKIMLLMMMPNNKQPTPLIPATTTTIENTTNVQTSSKDRNSNQPKRLEKNQSDSFLSGNAAAYVLVLRNNNSSKKSSSKSSSRLRKKRSTEYATLEAIDESSLQALRKAYKNSLKEITLNPNETPTEALMRYNAESIEEALAKANKQSMEISTSQVDEVLKEDNVADNIEHEPQIIQENGKVMPVATAPEITNNDEYDVTQPIFMSINPNQLQAESYNNILSKYQDSGVYNSNHKFLAHNPYLSMYSPLETVSYVNDYNVVEQPHQLANHKTVQDREKTAKSLVYQLPQMHFNEILSSPNAINTNLLHSSNYEVLLAKPHLSNEYSPTNAACNPLRQPQLHTHLKSRTEQTRDISSLDSIMAYVGQQLEECCNKCKDNILQSLNERLKHQYYANINAKSFNTFAADKSHALKGREPIKDEAFKHKQWLLEMSNKGYSQEHLNKQQKQQDFSQDGKLNLHLKDEHGLEPLFLKNGVSFKRETTFPDLPELVTEKETEMNTVPQANDYEIEKLEKVKNDNDEAQEIDTEDSEHEETKDQKTSTIHEEAVQIETVENKNSIHDSKENLSASLNTGKTLEIPESSTQSLYSLRGQFRPIKPNSRTFHLKHGKQFANYKNINKLGNANSIAKSIVKLDSEEKIEEIHDILHDRNNYNENNLAESSSSTMPCPTTSSIMNLTVSASNLIANTANGTEAVEKTTSENLLRRILKTKRKGSANLPTTGTE